MNVNDYGFQPEQNTLLAMFDRDLLSYDGQIPTMAGVCAIDKNEHPAGAKASLYTPDQGRLLYNVSPIGTTDFTLDFWMRYQSGYSGISMGEATVSNAAKGAVFTQGTAWIGSYSVNRVVVGAAVTYPTDWTHYALVRQGSNLYQFRNGKLTASVGNGQMDLTSTKILINGSYLNAYYGGPCNYKAVRLCGFARWTADFTPPKPTLKAVPCLYLDAQNKIYGMQNDVFTKQNDDWTILNDADKKALFLSTIDAAEAVDLSFIGKYKELVYSGLNNKPRMSMTAVPHDQLVTPNKLIRIEAYDGIDKATIASTISGNGACKILVTTDLTTYQTYDFATQTWQPIDHTDLAQVKASGMDAAALQTIDRAAWDLLTTGKSGIGFAYFLSIDSTADTCAVDKLTLQVDMRGSWDKAVHGTDYGYGYPYNTTLRVDIKTNGDYKINYCGGV